MLRLLRPRHLRPSGLLVASRSLVAVRPISTDSSYVTPLLLDNAPHTTAKTFAVHNPASLSDVLWRASAASLKDVELVTASAAAAFPVWSGKKLVERRDLLFKFAGVLERRGGELTECMCTETAAQEPWAQFNIHTSVGFVKEVAGRLTSIEGRLPESADEGGFCVFLGCEDSIFYINGVKGARRWCIGSRMALCWQLRLGEKSSGLFGGWGPGSTCSFGHSVPAMSASLAPL